MDLLPFDKTIEADVLDSAYMDEGVLLPPAGMKPKLWLMLKNFTVPVPWENFSTAWACWPTGQTVEPVFVSGAIRSTCKELHVGAGIPI